jgi:hypothetical protein
VAQRKETRITDVHVDVGFDDLDRSKVVMTLSANTRDNNGSIIHSYRQDITAEVTPEDIAILTPLIERAIARVMTDREITAEDLTEGLAAAIAERESLVQVEAVIEEEVQPLPVQSAMRSMVAASDDGGMMTEEEAREHQERFAEENRRAAREKEEEIARQIAEGEKYEAEQLAMREEQMRLDTIRRQQEEEAKGIQGAPVRVMQRARRPSK